MVRRDESGREGIRAVPGWHGRDLPCYFHATGVAPGASIVLERNTY